MSEAERLAAWCDEQLDRRAYDAGQLDGLFDDPKAGDDCRDDADKFRAIAALLRTQAPAPELKGLDDPAYEPADRIAREIVDLARDGQPVHGTVYIALNTAFKAGRSSTPAPPPAPEGWWLVPADPTEAMLHACKGALRAFLQPIPKDVRVAMFRGMRPSLPSNGVRVPWRLKTTLRYKAMLAASPQYGDNK